MFEIRVVGFAEVEEFFDWYTKIISVFKFDNMPNLGEHHLHVSFDDVHLRNPLFITPEKEHLCEVLEFTKDLKDDDKVLVHCLAGISRSTAIAIAILIQHGISYNVAYETIKSIRPELNPNRLIIKYTDELFELNGDLIQLIDKKHPKFSGIYRY